MVFPLLSFWETRERRMAGDEKIFFVIEEDGKGSCYVCTKSTERTKNIQGGNKQGEQDYSDNRMYEVGEVATLNPVGAELLLKKLNSENPYLFQKPIKNFVYDSDTWYTKEVLGKNTISEIMKNILKKREQRKRIQTILCSCNHGHRFVPGLE